jgi:hypothetical protein
MIRLTPEQFYERITDEGLKVITFYDGYVPNPKESKQYFYRVKNEDPNICLAAAKKLLETYPYQFTVVAYRLHVGSAEPPVVFMVDAQRLANNLNGLPGIQTMAALPAFSESEMREKILKELRAEMELDYLKKTIQAQNEELEGYRSGAKKLGAVGTEILYGFLSKSPKFKQALNGFSGTDQNEPQANEKGEPVTIQNREAVSKALNQCLTYLGESSFIKLAQKLEDNPGNADLLKSFI